MLIVLAGLAALALFLLLLAAGIDQYRQILALNAVADIVAPLSRSS